MQPFSEWSGQPNLRQPLWIRHLAKGYQFAIWVLAGLSPIAVAFYVTSVSSSQEVYHNTQLHDASLIAAVLFSSFVGIASYFNYRRSGELFLRYIALGQAAFVVSYVPHGLLVHVEHYEAVSFTIFGPLSRLFIGLYFLLGILRYHEGIDARSEKGRRRSLLPHIAGQALVVLGVYLAEGWISFEHQRVLEAGAIVLLCVDIVLLLRLGIRTTPIRYTVLALLLMIQAALTFLFAAPWNHLWWYGHVVFAASFGSLGYAVVRAYQTTGSFNLQLSEQDLLADLQTSHNRLQAYTIQVQQLAQAALQANATLSMRETLDVLTHCARDIVGAHQSVTSLTQGGDWSQAIQSISLSDKYDAWQSYAALPTGEGIYTEVCRQNRSMRLTQEELENHDAWRGFGKAAGGHPPMRGWLAAPLIDREGENIGLIQLSDKYEGEFTATDEAIVVQLAQIGSAAIENARMYEATMQAQREVARQARRAREADRKAILRYEELLEGLAQLAEAFGSATRLLDVYRALYHYINTFVACNGVFIALYDEATQMRTCVYAVASSAEEDVAKLPPLPLTESPQSRAVISGDVVIENAFHEAKKHFPTVDLQMEEDPEETHSSIAVPMAVKGKIIGVYEVQSPYDGAFGEEHVTALRMAAGLAAMALENTRLLENERELRHKAEASSARFRELFENANDIVFTMDMDGTLTSLNAAGESIFGLRREEAIGQKLFEILQMEDAGALRERLLAPRKTPVEVNLPARSGPARVLEINARPLYEDGAIVEVQAVARDVTERRQQQERLRQQDRLAAVGHLAAGVAHDFNNVMAVITLYVQLVLDHARLMEKDRDRLKVVFNQAQHASQLIDQILDFSRRSVMEKRAVDMRALMEKMVEMWERTLPAPIAIALEVQEGSMTVDGDATRLQQAFMNLALNAAQAMPDGGRLNITMAARSVGADDAVSLPDMAPGDWLVVEVRDSGVGMDPSIVSRIFEPFFTTKGPGEGSGLGLAQVYGIVRRHNGHIMVDTKQGSGTKFTIFLPLLQQLQMDEEVDGEAAVHDEAEQGRILLVEDNEMMLQAAMDGLETLGYEVVAARDGREALSRYRRNPFAVDLVISDVVMPEMGGEALVQELRKIRSDVRIIMMTGYPDGSNKQFLEAGSVYWIQKPYLLEEMAQKIREALQDRERV